jgi:hypothetical protein
MSTNTRKESTPKYFSPRNQEGYWRTAIRREMERMEAQHPGIFAATAKQQEAH